MIFHLIGRLRYKVPTHHITHGARRRQYDTLPAWQQDASSPLHTANTHMCRYIYNQSWCSHHYRPLHFPLFVLICDITGIRDTEILCTGSGVTDTTLDTLHNPNIIQSKHNTLHPLYSRAVTLSGFVCALHFATKVGH